MYGGGEVRLLARKNWTGVDEENPGGTCSVQCLAFFSLLTFLCRACMRRISFVTLRCALDQDFRRGKWNRNHCIMALLKRWETFALRL